MTTATRNKTTRTETSRLITIGDANGNRLACGITETKGTKTTSDLHFVARIEADFGVAFSFAKHGGDTHDVCLNAPGGFHTCDCPWGTYGSNKKSCRHVEAALRIVREGKL
jgi:hypothetical protein